MRSLLITSAAAAALLPCLAFAQDDTSAPPAATPAPTGNEIVVTATRTRSDDILGNVNVNSPLVLDGEASRVIRTYAAANQAPVCVPFILGGAMGPVTTAGALAQYFAEAVFCVALGQLERPGSPVILGNFLSSMSLKSGAPTFGTPESPLLTLRSDSLRVGSACRCVAAAICAHPRFPMRRPRTRVRIRCGRPAFLAGDNFILHSAGWLEAALVMSHEKFVMDTEQCGAFQVVGHGLTLDDNGFAMDAFREVGPGSHFLGSAHTMRNYETAFFDFELSDNNSFEQWSQEGAHDIVWRANQKWKAMLAAYQAPLVDPAKDEALSAFIAERKASMPDMNY